ncbi:MAG: hypothetical protein ACOYBY_07605, partial [Dermatophilaceae bacterium]
GSCVGPAPYPELGRDLQRVIGDEAREQILAQEGRLPEAVIACIAPTLQRYLTGDPGPDAEVPPRTQSNESM